MPRLANRVWETCNAPGTGTVTLLGAKTGPWKAFSAQFANADKVYYVMVDNNAGGTLWECGWGTWNTGNTLTRVAGQVEDGSSGAGTLVNFTGNPIDVYCDMTAGVLSGTTLAIGASGKASAAATNSTAIGTGSSGTYAATTATGSGAMALGGSYASGTDSFAAAITNNTSSYGAQGSNSLAIGKTAKASNNWTIAVGNGTQATSTGSVAIGTFAYSTAAYSMAIGYGANATISGKLQWASGYTVFGDSQYGVLILRSNTTDATPTASVSDGNPASINNQLILPNNSAFAFSGITVARQQAAGGTQSAAWQISGLIRREAAASTTTLVTSTVLPIGTPPVGWALALSADITNGGLAVTVTGAAATNIRWNTVVQSAEVTYT